MKRRGNISYMLFLAVTAAVGGLLFGYDTAVISGTVELVTARFGLDSLQQGWYVGCALGRLDRRGALFGRAERPAGPQADDARLGRAVHGVGRGVRPLRRFHAAGRLPDRGRAGHRRRFGRLAALHLRGVGGAPPGHAGLVLPAGRHDGISGGLYGQLPAAPHGTDRRFRNGVDAADLRR